ncbi:MAG: hypothetical protein HY721_33700 [Planctomycetes bacterium]|nr:hypothetical protein [Planctomycetota bacterium]
MSPAYPLPLASAAVAVAPSLLAMALAAGCGPSEAPGGSKVATAPVPGAPRAVPPPPPRPVPEELHGAYEEIQRLQGSRDFRVASVRFPAFLSALEGAWGAGSRDLAPYVYNYALTLRLGGMEPECLAIASKAAAQWPGELQLEVLEATVRSDLAVARGSFDSRADELLRSVLRPENHARLRGLRVDPAVLQARRADMLFRAKRLEDARKATLAALDLDPKNRVAREVQARVLLALKRPAEALPVIAGLLAERADPALELSAAMALLDLGRPAEAWERLSRLIAGEATAGSSSEELGAFRDTARLRGAKALNELGRHAEALRTLLEGLPRDPDDGELLQEAARAARGLGTGAGAGALEQRVRALQGRQRLLHLASQARAAGFAASVPYYQSLAALEVDDAGEALALIEKALALGPNIAQLHAERARVRLLLGTLAAAEAGLREAEAKAPPSLLLPALARVVVMRGRPDEARRILSDPRAGPPAPGASSREETWAATERSIHSCLTALAHLELGEPAKAAPAAGGAPDGGAPGAVLAGAELLVVQGKVEGAQDLLASSFEEIPGAAGWADALRQLCSLIAAGAAGSLDGTDPSRLLDHPRLFLDAAYRCPPPAAERLRAAHARRLELLAAIERCSEGDAPAAWRRLLAHYAELKAARKAREAAFHLARMRPGGLDEQRALVETLAAPETALPRLKAIGAGLRIAPGDADLLSRRKEAWAALGLGDG